MALETWRRRELSASHAGGSPASIAALHRDGVLRQRSEQSPREPHSRPARAVSARRSSRWPGSISGAPEPHDDLVALSSHLFRRATVYGCAPVSLSKFRNGSPTLCAPYGRFEVKDDEVSLPRANRERWCNNREMRCRARTSVSSTALEIGRDPPYPRHPRPRSDRRECRVSGIHSGTKKRRVKPHIRREMERCGTEASTCLASRITARPGQ